METVIEIFRTNVRRQRHSEKIIEKISVLFPGSLVTFDLEDCDKILRVENRVLDARSVISCVKACGFSCEILS